MPTNLVRMVRMVRMVWRARVVRTGAHDAHEQQPIIDTPPLNFNRTNQLLELCKSEDISYGRSWLCVHCANKSDGMEPLEWLCGRGAPRSLSGAVLYLFAVLYLCSIHCSNSSHVLVLFDS